MDSATIEKTLSERGAEVLKDADRVKDVWSKAKCRSRDIPSDTEDSMNALENIKIMLSMVQDYLRGDYKNMSRHSLTILIGTLAYCASPIDLIPDPIPAIGLSDDVALILFAAGALIADIITYKNWKSSQSKSESKLSQYLDETVGSNHDARQAEINRLARVYDTVLADAAVEQEKAKEVETQ